MRVQIVVSVLLFMIFSSLGLAQTVDCTRSSSLSRSRSYNMTGTAYLERFDDGTIQLRLGEDFLTERGPDVQIYLSNDSTSIAGGVMIGDIGDTDGANHFNGEIVFDVPSDVVIGEYSHIVFRCITFSAFWGSGSWSVPSCEPDTEMPVDTMTNEPVCLENVVATTNWEKEVTICPNDDIADVVPLKANIDIELGENYSFLITNVNNDLIEVVNEEEYDFEGTSLENQYVFGIYYRGDLSYTIGEPITSITADSCWELSSNTFFLTVSKVNCASQFDCVPTVTATTNWAAEVNICPSDGIEDDVPFINNQGQEVGDHYAYIITDTLRNIEEVSLVDSYDFEGSTSATQLVFGVSYAGNLNYSVGSSLETLSADSCFIISDLERFLTVTKQACSAMSTTRNISGRVATANGVGISNVSIVYGDGLSVSTDASGNFIIEEVPIEDNLKLIPAYNADAANGISAIDLILVTRHILGLDPFADPLQLLSADVNGNGSISASDLVGIQRVLLNQTTEFGARGSWQFIDASLTLDINVLRSGLSQYIRVLSGADDIEDLNFIALKTGDVNGSANPN